MGDFFGVRLFFSSIFIIVLIIIVIPLAIVFTLLKLLGGLFGILLALLGQLIFLTFVKSLYISRFGLIHVWATKKFGGKGYHSRIGNTAVVTTNGFSVRIFSIACLSDNYAYLIVNEGKLSEKAEDRSKIETSTMKAAIVDPGDATAVLEAIQVICTSFYSGATINLEAILTTHHHWDHQAGNRQLVRLHPNLKVYGGWRDKVDKCTHQVMDKEIIDLCDGILISVLESPCHTHGSIIYKLKVGPVESDCLFTGDTLFLGGCGAPFEEKKDRMYRNFWQIKRQCNPASLIFPGHEYTTRILSDLLNSRDCPTNPSGFFALCSALYRAVHFRNLSVPAPTVPYSLAEELQYNPNFKAAGHAGVLVRRAWKNICKIEGFMDPSCQKNNFYGFCGCLNIPNSIRS
jgi:hydroxyacylglutathione hydrolase